MGIKGLLFCLGVGLVLVGCVTPDSGISPVHEPVFEVVSQEESVLQMEVRRISGEFIPYESPGLFESLFWTYEIIKKWNGSLDIGASELSRIKEYLFIQRPREMKQGAYQEIQIFLQDRSTNPLVIQNQYYDLPQGVGNLEPRPWGMVSLQNPTHGRQFLLFSDGAMLPVEWWAGIPAEGSWDFDIYLAVFGATSKDELPHPYLQGLFGLRIGTIEEVQEILTAAQNGEFADDSWVKELNLLFEAYREL